MNANKCEIDIKFDIGAAGIGKLRAMRDPLWLVKKLDLLDGVVGVGFGPDFIRLSITGDLPTATKTMKEAQFVINQELI